MTICRKCGTSNQDGKKFCVFCHELLIADPVEMAKRTAALQKKQKKVQKKLDAKHKRWKRALLLLIPIGIFDLIDLLLCLDLAFVGIGSIIGRTLGDFAVAWIGTTMRLFGNLVYTADTVEYVIRVLEFLGALGLILIASALTVVMIVRMIKWRVYCKKGDSKEKSLAKEMQDLQGAQAAQQKSASAAPVQGGIADESLAANAQTVSYAALAEIAAQKQAYVMPAPANETDCKQMFAALVPLLWEYDEDSVRRILSAMSASRLLLCSAGALDSAGIFDHLSRAFGVRAEQFAPSSEQGDLSNFAGIALQRDAKSGELSHTAFAKALYAASFSPENIYFAGVSGVCANAVNAVFSPLASYFGVPEGNTALYLGYGGTQSLPEGFEEGRLVLPANLWMLNVLPEDDRAPAVGGNPVCYAAVVYLRNSGRAFPPESAEGAQTVCVSTQAWERAVAAAENEHFLADEYWNVIDAIETQIKEQGGGGFANRTLRMFEKYTAVFLACGGKQSEAFDNGFAAVIVPACAEQLRALADKTEGETLSALLERTVGREKMPVTVDVLTLMNLM